MFSDPDFGAPALRQALAGLDLSTPEGRAAAQKALEALFAQLQTGSLDPSQLGGLTAQELLDAILETSELLRSSDAAAADGTGGFNVSRTITEVTGSRIAGLLTSANVWAQQTAENTAMLLAVLSHSQPVSVAPPSVASLTTPADRLASILTALQSLASERGSGAVLNVNIAMPVGTSAEQARALGSALTDPIIAELDRLFGLKVRRLTRANGSALLSG